MNLISRAEELILLAMLGLGDEAIGISILEFLQVKTGNAWSFAQIYDFIEIYYNRERRHSALNDQTPIEFAYAAIQH